MINDSPSCHQSIVCVLLSSQLDAAAAAAAAGKGNSLLPGTTEDVVAWLRNNAACFVPSTAYKVKVQVPAAQCSAHNQSIGFTRTEVRRRLAAAVAVALVVALWSQQQRT